VNSSISRNKGKVAGGTEALEKSTRKGLLIVTC
jgi:hypothetical protein